jgi:uncharacterized RDD family membrane protein YckC
MKCPKCGYLGFERVDRCRNCQYDFSLSSNIPEPDFTIRRDTETAGPLADLSLVDAAGPGAARSALSEVGADLDRMFGEVEPGRAAGVSMSLAAVAEPPPASAPAATAAPASAPARRAELPLFGPPIPDDEPLITRASPPRPPLAVRRSTPDTPRLRSDSALRTPSFDLALDVSDPSPTSAVLPADRVGAERYRHSPEPYRHEDGSQDAGVGARLFAVVVDLLILAVIDAVVIYFTMQLCALNIEDVGILPKGPLIAFLFVQNGGYLVAFTAGGQTLGKMAAGIRVVQSDSEGTLDLGRAFLRTSMWVVLAVPAGLGFVSALFSRDHRGLHDRFAGTRVVRASA